MPPSATSRGKIQHAAGMNHQHEMGRLFPHKSFTASKMLAWLLKIKFKSMRLIILLMQNT